MRTRFPILPLLLLLSGCGTPPQAPIPDGANRVAINSPTAIARYLATLAPAERSAARGDPAQSSAAPEPAMAAPHAKPAPAPAAAATAARPACRPTAIGAAQLVCQEHGLLFRIPALAGRTAFAPDAPLAALLLRAAALSNRIAIRGRTDAELPDALNRQLAERRAWSARQYLLAHGIAAPITTSSLAAGDFIADNRQPAGQAANRRVEIELQGLAAADLAALNAMLREGQP